MSWNTHKVDGPLGEYQNSKYDKYNPKYGYAINLQLYAKMTAAYTAVHVITIND